LQIAESARAVIVLSVLAAQRGNRSVGTDAGGAALLGQAALRAAMLNVDVNLAALRDEAQRERFAARRQMVVDGVDELVAATLAAIIAQQG
ncbi:MAG TPA: cyclodeaminase/cyclohydrolase family protein, partial [Ktedonobacterales bacterium]|nr:cyclodeaminase/cyclohydrolase family protein [Ktedonobacterales bacterium]